jgi:hypothetical protein
VVVLGDIVGFRHLAKVPTHLISTNHSGVTFVYDESIFYQQFFIYFS